MKSDIKTPPRPSSFINLFTKDSSTRNAASMDAGLRESGTTRTVGMAAGHKGSRRIRISSMASGHRDSITIRTAGISAGPRALTMVAGHITPHFKKPERRPLLLECASSQETGNGWVKRLRLKSSDSVAFSEAGNGWVKRLRPKSSDSAPFSFKRTKTGENSYEADARNLLSIILNHEDCNNYLYKCDLNKTPLLTQNGECAYEESKTISHWIRRWRCASRQAVPLRKVAAAAASVLYEQKPSDMHRTSEDRQVPSIKAMALMGSAAKKSVTYRYKKKGSLMVWSM